MKRIALFVVGLVIVGAAFTFHAQPKSVGAQARNSNSAQTRFASAAIASGQPVSSTTCPIGVSTAELCVGPTTTTGLAAGISIQDCALGDSCQIMMTGVAVGNFDATLTSADLNDLAINIGGVIHGQSGNLYSQSNLVGCMGRITGLVDATHAWVTMFHPASACLGVDPTTIIGQLSSSQVSGLSTVATTGNYADLIGKPTIPSGTVTGVTATAPITSTGGAAPVIACPTCITSTYIKGTSGTITGTLLAAGGFDSGTVTVAGATAGMSCGAVSATDGTLLNSFILSCTVTGSGANNVTVAIASPVIGTPPTKSYNFRIFP